MINQQLKLIRLCHVCHTETCIYSPKFYDYIIKDREPTKEDLEVCYLYTGKSKDRE